MIKDWCSTTGFDENMASGCRAAMKDYDLQAFEEFSFLKSKVDSFFVDDVVDCPYCQPYTATFHQAVFGPLNERIMELFLFAGYRRNGNSMYDMHCKECSACVSIRLHPHEFQPNRNQKRTRKKNRDVEIIVEPIKLDNERIQLCDSFLSTRYPQKRNTAFGYYSCFFLNEITDTYEIQYRLNGKLIGVSIIDLGENWMNAVYFYFDPKMANRSLGTFNILTMVDLCLERKLSYLYLGYTINDVSAMNYKENFFPHYILKDESWLRVDKKTR